MNRTVTGIVIVAIVAAVVGWSLYLQRSGAPVDVPSPAVTLPPAPEPVAEPPSAEPPVRAPTPPAPPPPPLPALADSDRPVLDELRARVASAALERVLVNDDVVRRLVATVDNLGRDSVSMKVRAVQAVPERFLTSGRDSAMTLDPANYARYRGHVRLLTSVSPGDAADLYVRYYPLLQEAYAQLGYPDQPFHARLLAIVDQLLATPEVSGPIRLWRPHVLYQYADPELEALPAGSKMLLRAGPDNAAAVKDWLRAWRVQLEARQLN